MEKLRQCALRNTRNYALVLSSNAPNNFIIRLNAV